MFRLPTRKISSYTTLAVALVLMLACGSPGMDTSNSLLSPFTSAVPRDVSGFAVFQPQVTGALFEYEIPTTEELIEIGLQAVGASPTHIAVIGSPVAGSSRCEWLDTVMTNGQREADIRFMLRIAPEDPLPTTAELQTVFNSFTSEIATQYRDSMRANFHHLVNGGVLEDSRILACYVDYTVSEYLLGSGPTTLTVAYDQLAKSRSYDLYQKAHTAGRYGSDALLTAEQYAAADAATVTATAESIKGAVMGRKSVVFLAPMAAHNSIAVEAWQAVAQWDVQTIDGVETAVRYGAGANDAEYSQPLAAFKTRVTTAAASDAHAGQRIANVSGLRQYYRDIGAYGDITPNDGESTTSTPALPPPSCTGAVIPNAGSNPGLVRDCRTLLAVKDTLAGTATLNWSEDVLILNWDGLKVAEDPPRVTRLTLFSRELDGVIPPELGELSGLERLVLPTNRLTGPIPGELGRLSKLEFLWLHDNSLTGKLPPQLGSLSQLRQLLLSDNELSGAIPQELGSLSRLEAIWLQRNRLSGGIPSPAEQADQSAGPDSLGQRVDGDDTVLVGQLEQLGDALARLQPVDWRNSRLPGGPWQLA